MPSPRPEVGVNTAIDQVQLRFDSASLTALNVIIGLIMFGVALDLRFEDFRRVARSPKGPLIGLGAQFVLFPAFSFLLTRVLDPWPSIALGMILVAACPGGNISNIVTHLAGGNTALSISMTAVSTAAAVIATPLNLAFWGSLDPGTQALLHRVHLDPVELFVTVLILLGVPLVAGMTVAHFKPKIAKAAHKPVRALSVVFFLAFVGFALAKNFDYFLKYVGTIMIAVALQNGLALAGAYGLARGLGEDRADSRAISIEVGIQNSALGLVLIFTFFDGMGGMAITAAWWGVWHIVGGLGAAAIYQWGDKRRAARERA